MEAEKRKQQRILQVAGDIRELSVEVHEMQIEIEHKEENHEEYFAYFDKIDLNKRKRKLSSFIRLWEHLTGKKWDDIPF